MLKKIGFSAIAMLGLLAFAPHQAKAAVRFGVVVGRPAYNYPVYPAYPPAAVVEAPAYAPVYVNGGWVRRDVRRDWDRDARFHRDRDDRGFRDRR
ncbi:MAG TPA: hypothetical protein VKR61_07035 [Bryobacteraceae bacterium]|nr:hypothetical protein [Bryobacteraceae bacterium]